MKVLVLFTCFNRKEKTENCVKLLTSGNPSIDFQFVIVDDGSTDGTSEMLEKLKNSYNITVLNGNNLYYSGGMRFGMQYIKENELVSDYFLMVNDDVDFFEDCIEKLVNQSKKQNSAVIVGTTIDNNGEVSYGAVKYLKGIKYKTLTISEWRERADTFNANCVLIPWRVFKSTPIMDSRYIHSLGDFDYGFSISKNGFEVHSSNDYVGICNKNSAIGTWTDTSLSIRQRLKAKESIKGAPTKQWFYYLNKNFGILSAVKSSITPFIRIIIKK